MKLLSLFSVLLLVLVGCAGTTLQKDESLPNVPEVGKHFFWQVSDDNSSVWILGSVHFADSTFYPLDSVIETAYVNAEELAVEIDLSDDSVSNEVATKSLQQGMLPAGTTLNQVLPRAMWNTLDSICAAWNFPVMGLMRLRPWFAATTLSVIALQRAGINPEYGVDVVMMDRAAIDGKAIVGLETADEQVGALADTSDSDSAGIYYLKTTLNEISMLDSMVAQMMRAWKTGDEELLRSVMDDDRGKPSDEGEEKIRKDMEDRVYTSRNGKMAKSIARFLVEDRNVFVVIGAAHLVLDEDNVIEQLRNSGYKVTRY
ncbi:MAG: TraB/GumN family protein [Fibrobacter sp.]|nr:TraB/GumN family protein [Fibrobacter sp.]